MQNRKPPAYQEYAATILADIQFRTMSLLGRGLFYTMRLECWANVRLPSNPKLLARTLGLDENSVSEVISEVMPYFKIVDGCIICPELDDYRQHLDDRKSKQSAGGKNGATITNLNRKKTAKQGGVYLAEGTGNPQVARRGNDDSLVQSSTEKQSQEQSLKSGDNKSFVDEMNEYERRKG